MKMDEFNSAVDRVLFDARNRLSKLQLTIMEYMQTKIGFNDSFDTFYSIPLKDMYALCHIDNGDKEKLKYLTANLANSTMLDVICGEQRTIFPLYDKFIISKDKFEYRYSEEVFPILQREIKNKYCNICERDLTE